LAFLLGSIPFGLIIAKAKGIDIRKHGSGNIGATNVFRVVGKKYGLSCLFLDMLKGLIPTIIGISLIRFAGMKNPMIISALDPFSAEFPMLNAQIFQVFTGLCAVLGHNYSPWVGFKGGKGIATSAGVLIALMPAAVVILALIFIVVLVLTRYVAVASMAAAALLPVLTLWGSWFHGKIQNGTWNKPLFLFSLIIGILAIWKHRTNIRRLKDGTESKFTWGGNKKPADLDP
jgi:glycerol-3-phosphate acyltransferase PlsY